MTFRTGHNHLQLVTTHGCLYPHRGQRGLNISDNVPWGSPLRKLTYLVFWAAPGAPQKTCFSCNLLTILALREGCPGHGPALRTSRYAWRSWTINSHMRSQPVDVYRKEIPSSLPYDKLGPGLGGPPPILGSINIPARKTCTVVLQELSEKEEGSLEASQNPPRNGSHQAMTTGWKTDVSDYPYEPPMNSCFHFMFDLLLHLILRYRLMVLSLPSCWRHLVPKDLLPQGFWCVGRRTCVTRRFT